MSDTESPDWYEVLQVSPRADTETILRVFRHLAKRLHPDNGESGNADRFNDVLEAFRILSDPALRARYDARYEHAREQRWRIFDQNTAMDNLAGDRRVRSAVLSLLYTKRRNDPDHPGLGTVHIENLLGCPEEHLKFHVWYLKENGWIQRLENGLLAITAAGVDHVLDNGGPGRHGLAQIESGERMANGNGSHPHDPETNGDHGTFHMNGNHPSDN